MKNSIYMQVLQGAIYLSTASQLKLESKSLKVKEMTHVSEGSLPILFNRRSKPYLAVIFLQFGQAGLSIIAKFALNQGMSHYTFAVYRNVVAAAVFAPFAVVLERKVRPRMTFSIFFKIMLLSLLEPVIDQNLYYTGLKYTTATFSAAMGNILPAITFLMAWAFRMEKVNIRKLHSQAKVGGTLVTVGGAMVMTLIKGSAIGLAWAKQRSIDPSTIAANQQDPIKGAVMITAGCLCWASFYILQAITLESYPADLSLTTFVCSAGALQGAVLTFIVEGANTAVWSISWDIKLLAALYAGIINSGITYYVSGVIMKERGPVFVTAFNPLSMVIVAVMGSFILSEQMYLGGVVGAVVIVMGLYMVIWGKSKDHHSSESGGDQIAPVDAAAVDDGGTEASNQKSTNVSEAARGDEAV